MAAITQPMVGSPFRQANEEDPGRTLRLQRVQYESLASNRRDFISTADYNNDPIDFSALEATRLANQPGTDEHVAAQAAKTALGLWSNAWRELQDDGTADDGLRDVGGGQTHRLRLAAEVAGKPSTRQDDHSIHSAIAARSGRTRRAGRGGGIVGTRGRGDQKREGAKYPHQSLDKVIEEAFHAKGKSISGRLKNATEGILNTKGKSKPARGSQLPRSNLALARPQRHRSPNYTGSLASPETLKTVDLQPTTPIIPTMTRTTTQSSFTNASVGDAPNPCSVAALDKNSTTEVSRRPEEDIIFSPEIDFAPDGFRVPTPPPPTRASYFDELQSLMMEYKSTEEDPNTTAPLVTTPASEQGNSVTLSNENQVAPLLIRKDLIPEVRAAADIIRTFYPEVAKLLEMQIGASEEACQQMVDSDDEGSGEELIVPNTSSEKVVEHTSSPGLFSSQDLQKISVPHEEEMNPYTYDRKNFNKDGTRKETIFGEHIYRSFREEDSPVSMTYEDTKPISKTETRKSGVSFSETAVENTDQATEERKDALKVSQKDSSISTYPVNAFGEHVIPSKVLSPRSKQADDQDTRGCRKRIYSAEQLRALDMSESFPPWNFSASRNHTPDNSLHLISQSWRDRTEASKTASSLIGDHLLPRRKRSSQQQFTNIKSSAPPTPHIPDTVSPGVVTRNDSIETLVPLVSGLDLNRGDAVASHAIPAASSAIPASGTPSIPEGYVDQMPQKSTSENTTLRSPSQPVLTERDRNSPKKSGRVGSSRGQKLKLPTFLTDLTPSTEPGATAFSEVASGGVRPLLAPPALFTKSPALAVASASGLVPSRSNFTSYFPNTIAVQQRVSDTQQPSPQISKHELGAAATNHHKSAHHNREDAAGVEHSGQLNVELPKPQPSPKSWILEHDFRQDSFSQLSSPVWSPAKVSDTPYRHQGNNFIPHQASSQTKVLDASLDLQASIYASAFTGPTLSQRSKFNETGFLGEAQGNKSRERPTPIKAKDPWDKIRREVEQ